MVNLTPFENLLESLFQLLATFCSRCPLIYQLIIEFIFFMSVKLEQVEVNGEEGLELLSVKIEALSEIVINCST